MSNQYDLLDQKELKPAQPYIGRFVYGTTIIRDTYGKSFIVYDRKGEIFLLIPYPLTSLSKGVIPISMHRCYDWRVFGHTLAPSTSRDEEESVSGFSEPLMAPSALDYVEADMYKMAVWTESHPVAAVSPPTTKEPSNDPQSHNSES